ncbi:MAG TPA: tetratricopeptide repeat protein [Ignavibacteriaceae bacterium]|nr:tetratricopeptide repeat protein [Ignavibacteriaceae bacterium]
MRALVILSILFAFLITPVINAQKTDSSSANEMDPKAASYYNDAIQFMKAQQYQDALKFLDSSLMISKDYRSYFLQGQAYLKLDQADNAKKSFGECLKLNPNFEMGWMGSGDAHFAAKEYDLAMNDYKKAAEVSQNPEVKKNAQEAIIRVADARAKEDYNKGLAFLKSNQFNEAEDAFKASIAKNDSFDLGYIGLATAQAANKDYEGAIKSYEKALSLTKNENLKKSIKDGLAKTYIIAGNNAFKEKKYDQSISWMMKSLEVSPSDAAYLGLAKAYIEKQKYKDAVTALDSAKTVQKAISDGAIAYYTGVVQLNMGEEKQAIESFTEALSDPTYKKASQSQIDYIKAKQKGAK